MERYFLSMWAAVGLLAVESHGQSIQFSDAGLEGAVRNALSIGSAPITTASLENLSILDASYRDIKNLTGLESATRLTELNLSGNRNLTDLSPLQSLIQLESLDLNGTLPANLEALTGMTKLKTLHVTGNDFISGGSFDLALAVVADQSQIPGPEHGEKNFIIANVSGNTHIRAYNEDDELLIDWNEQDDPAAETNRDLLQLDQLLSPFPQVESLTDEQRFEIIASAAGASDFTLSSRDLEILASIQQLEVLTVQNIVLNEVTDLFPLSPLALTTLEVFDNPIADWSPLASLTQLTELDASNVQAFDLDAVSGLTELRELRLHRAGLVSVAGLSPLTKLQQLDVSNNQLRSLDGLGSLSELGTGTESKFVTRMGQGFNFFVHVDVSRNFFDVAPEAPARILIDEWEASGARVYYEDQQVIASSVRVDLKRRSENAVVKGMVTLMLTGAPARSAWTVERSANLETWSEVTNLGADSQGTATYVASFLEQEGGNYLRILPSNHQE